MPEYQYRGARSAVILHAEEMHRFLHIWKRARSAGVDLPVVNDPNYATFDTLLAHVFRWARTYLVWSCEQLGLPDPGIRAEPDPPDMASEADSFADHLLQAWESSPLRDVPAWRYFEETYAAPWGVHYCVDAMLEHAVMHPAKHRFQLEEMMGETNADRNTGGHP